MRKSLLIAAALVAAVYPAFAQVASGNVRLGAGKSAPVSANKDDGGSAYVEVALPSGPQKLEGLGDQFLPLKSGGKDVMLATVDLNGDGTDEIVVRGQVTPTDSAVMVFQWDKATSQFLPVQFTNSQDEDKPFLFADAASSVMVEKGGIEVRLLRTDQSGRSAVVVERYRWDGDGIKYTEDH